MPISESELREPRFVKLRDRYPMTYDKKARYTDTIVNPNVAIGRSVSVDGTGWKAPGYNPNHNSTKVEKVNLTSESPTFKPY
jgi:hypothetical protein